MKISSIKRCRDSYCLNVIIPVALVILVAVFTGCGFYSESGSRGYAWTDHVSITCTPNGRVQVNQAYYSGTYDDTYWNPAMFLSITLGFGSFSYASAKAIDVSFDLVVGRCGQGLLAILAYPVIRRSLVCRMERRPVRIPVYTSLAFDRVSLTAFCTILRDLFRAPEKRTKSQASIIISPLAPWNWTWLRYVGFLLVLLYILVFPTLASVMTGYQAKYVPYVERPDNHFLMEVSQLQIPQLVVVDGKRIGLVDYQPIYKEHPFFDTLIDYAATVNYGPDVPKYPDPNYDLGDQYVQPCFKTSYTDYIESSELSGVDPLCSLNANYTTAGSGNTFIYSTSNITLGNKTWNLELPPVSMLIQCDSGYPYLAPGGVKYWSAGNLTFSQEYLQIKGSCEPSDRYEWGFSSITLFIFCVSTALFAMLLTALHVEPFVYGRTDRFRLEFNHYRDAVDLVYELRNNYFGESIEFERELKVEVEKGSKVIALDSSELPLSRRDEGRERRGNKEFFLDNIMNRFRSKGWSFASWREMREWKAYAKACSDESDR